MYFFQSIRPLQHNPPDDEFGDQNSNILPTITIHLLIQKKSNRCMILPRGELAHGIKDIPKLKDLNIYKYNIIQH